MRIRKLYIKAIATSDFKKHYKKNWQEIIKKTIADSSEIFEKEFKIKLVLKETKIRRSGTYEAMPYSIFNYAKNLAENNNAHDIAVTFTNAPFFCDGWQDYYEPSALGVIMHSGKLILLTNPERTRGWRGFYEWKYYENIDWASLKFLLIHELGHLFEAKDVKDGKSYMFEKMLTSQSRYFDKENKKTILKNKWRKFKSAR